MHAARRRRLLRALVAVRGQHDLGIGFRIGDGAPAGDAADVGEGAHPRVSIVVAGGCERAVGLDKLGEEVGRHALDEALSSSSTLLAAVSLSWARSSTNEIKTALVLVVVEGGIW